MVPLTGDIRVRLVVASSTVRLVAFDAGGAPERIVAVEEHLEVRCRATVEDPDDARRVRLAGFEGVPCAAAVELALRHRVCGVGLGQLEVLRWQLTGDPVVKEWRKTVH